MKLWVRRKGQSREKEERKEGRGEVLTGEDQKEGSEGMGKTDRE